jgi:hypothetical protein
MNAERAAKEAAAMRNAAVIYTADLIQQDAARPKQTASALTVANVQGVSIATPQSVTTKPASQQQAQPSWVKRKLIALRDWLFNVCVSVEKEANK